MSENKTSVAVDLPEALINIAREIEALKRDCGMDPESAIAIQNGRYMALSYKVRTLAAGQAVAQPVGTWCDGCSPENCRGCHILIGLLFIVFAACLFVLFGWVTAHETVATECQKLNAFYVGDKVFECRLKEGKKL